MLARSSKSSVAYRVLRSRSSPHTPHSRGPGSGPVEVHSRRQAPRGGRAVGRSRSQAHVAVEGHTAGRWAGGTARERRAGLARGCCSARAGGRAAGSVD